MMDTLKLALLVLSLVEAFAQRIESDFVLVNTPYTFPGNASSCERAEWRKKSSLTDATIASKYQNRVCPIEKDFRGEFSCKENHLLLNSAKYTDQGRYVFVCNEDEKALILDVLYAINMHMTEMDSITLNCYAVNAKDVMWLHNNESVLHYKKDGSVNPGKGFEGRVSLEKNCLKTGDLSLTITGVRKTDAGIYRCFVDDETTKGYPHTYLLHVKEKRSSPGATDSSCNEAQTLIYMRFTIVLGTFSGILALVVVILLYKLCCPTSKPLKGQSTSATTNRREQKSEDDTTDSVLLCNMSPKNESQLMVNHPVQVSDTTENKPSNTRPF